MNEKQMVEAHKLGLLHATRIFGDLAKRVKHYYDDPDEKISYIAGFMGELARLAKKEIKEKE